MKHRTNQLSFDFEADWNASDLVVKATMQYGVFSILWTVYAA